MRVGIAGALLCTLSATIACGGSGSNPSNPAKTLAPPTTSATRATPEGIPFHFAWPSAMVQAHWTRFASRSDGTVNREVTASYTLQVTRGSDQTQIAFLDFKLLDVKGTAPTEAEYYPPKGIVASGTVSNDGKLFTPTNTITLRDAFLTIAEHTQARTGYNAATRWLVDHNSREDPLRQNAINTWDALVADLAESSLDPHRTTVSTGTASFTLPGGPTLETEIKWTVKPEQPCIEHGPPDCVVVEHSSVPKSTKELVKFLAATIAKHESRPFQLEAFESTDEYRSLINPRTLQPYEAGLTVETRIRARSGHAVQDLRERSGWRLHLDWEENR